jgi:hypothetical protein
MQVYFDGVLTTRVSGYSPTDETSACYVYGISGSLRPPPGHHNLTLLVDPTIKLIGEITVVGYVAAGHLAFFFH